MIELRRMPSGLGMRWLNALGGTGISMKLLTKAGAIFDSIIAFLARWASTLFIATMLIVCIEVFMRYFLNRPQTWVVETTEFGLLFIAFLGAAYLLKQEWHVKIDMVLARLSRRGQALLNTITSILGVAICLTFVVYGTQATMMCFEIGRRTRGAMLTLQWPLIMIMPIGFFLLSIQFLRRARSYFRDWRILLNEEQRR